MNNEIIVALISASASIVGVIVTSRNTLNKMSYELDKAVALLKQEMSIMKEDLKEHNHYAKLYAETMPVVQQELKNLNNRLENLERKVN